MWALLSPRPICSLAVLANPEGAVLVGSSLPSGQTSRRHGCSHIKAHMPKVMLKGLEKVKHQLFFSREPQEAAEC